MKSQKVREMMNCAENKLKRAREEAGGPIRRVLQEHLRRD
jgi:hypothetical protein